MPVNIELLNSTFEDFRGPLVSTFVRNTELLDILEKKSRLPIEGGTYIERTMATGSPARGKGMFTGDELLNLQRFKKTKKISVQPHRLVVVVTIPNKDLIQNSGKAAVIKLIEEYPKMTMDGIAADLNSYLLTGVSRDQVFATAEMRGLITLNGLVSTGIGQGVQHGLLDFADPSSQTDPVQGVTKSQADFIFNQYENISTFSSTGWTQLRRVYRKCAHHAGKPKSGPDVVIMDDETFENYESEKRGLIRLSLTDDKTERTNMIMNDIGLAEVYSSLDLDRTKFTGDGANGVAYFLNTDWFDYVLQEAPSMGAFQDKIADQDVVCAKFSMQGNLICRKLIAQGVAAGGAT